MQFLLFFFNTLFLRHTATHTVHTVPAFTQISEYLKFFNLIPITQLKTDFFVFLGGLFVNDTSLMCARLWLLRISTVSHLNIKRLS